MNRKLMVLVVLMTLILAACTLEQTPEGEPTAYPIDTLVPTPTTAPTEPPSLTETAEQIIIALADRDLERVAEFVHPEMGVRFSPYGFVRDEHQVFTPDSLAGLFESDTVYTWGNYDGTGDPIELTFEDYYEEFVYSSDFANPEEMAVDERIGQGNTINNIDEFYPASSFVEYHFSGFEEQYEGMDWESLRLVFVEEDGIWYLVGIVHDEWTI